MTTKPKNSKKKQGTDIPLDNIPPRTKKSYTDDFKTTAANRVINGESAEKVARALDIPTSSMILKWVRRIKDGEPLTNKTGGPRKSHEGVDNIASMLKQAVARASKARDERLDAAAMIVANDIGGKDGEALAKAIRAHQHKAGTD